MKVVQIQTRNFLLESSPMVRYLFLSSLATFTLSLLFFIVFVALGRLYKDIFGKTHYQVRYRQIDITSLCLSIVTLVLIVIVLSQYIRIFKFQKSGVFIGLCFFLLVTLVLIAGQTVFLVLNFCNDPEKHYNDYGECTCKNNLLEINGKCSCPSGTYRVNDSCLPGCRTADDCQGGGECLGGFCCPSPYVNCDNQCCPPNECKGGTCCGSPDRVCKNQKTGIVQCCIPGETCINNTCVAVCGPPDNQFTCADGETCLQVNGNDESLKTFQSSFPPEQKSIIENGTLYTCIKPPDCGIQDRPVFLPPVVNNDTVTFYPCYRTGEWLDLDKTKVKPEDESRLAPLQLNICVPKSVDVPFETYQHCWQKIRDGTNNDVNNCEDETCELLNILKLDYLKDTTASERVNKAIKFESLKTDDEGAFLGNYCGDGAVRIRSIGFAGGCHDIQDKGHATLQNGVFTNSRYVYFDDNVCNTYFDCTADEQNDNNFFTSYSYNDIKTDFRPYTLSQNTFEPTLPNTLIDYMKDCLSPEQCTPVDPTIWPDSKQYCECPGNLHSLETPRTGSEGQWTYDSKLCTKNGYLVHEKQSDLTLVCNDPTSCRKRVSTDNPVLRNFSDEQKCQNYCQTVIFTNTWYTIRMCLYDKKYGEDCSSTKVFQIKFDKAGDESGQKIPVIAQTDHYDISLQHDDGTPLTKSCNKCVKNARVYYISGDQMLCPLLPCTTPPDVRGDGPNSNLNNRELRKDDTFVIGAGPFCCPPSETEIWYRNYYVEESDSVKWIKWQTDCEGVVDPLWASTCESQSSPVSRVEKFYLRFV